MNWTGIWHLGIRYLKRKRVKTALLIGAFTLVWLLPSVIGILINRAEDHLSDRASSTPLVIGRSGSPLELVFNSIYFTKPEQPTFPLKEYQELGNGIQYIPIYSRFSATDYRIVGTSIDYFNFRKLEVDTGRTFIRLGECVVGSSVAEKENLEIGDSIISSPGSMFDIAGVYPLKMKIVGILRSTGTADDSAIFVDLKTTWVIEGLGHGHEEANQISEDGILSKEEGRIRLNASVEHYNEITPENANTFHFHGDIEDFPITALIAIPQDAKAQALLKGKYLSSQTMQIITPIEKMDELFATVFTVQRLVTGMLFLVGLATLLIGFLAFSLSYRLRIQEFENLSNMGADRGFLRLLIGFEAIFVLIVSLILAGLGILILQGFAPMIIRSVIG